MRDIARSPLPSIVDRLELPGGLPSVSPICLGITQSASTIAAAFERGCNFFFLTCDMHWPRYVHARRGLSELIESVGRNRIVVAAVIYVTQPEFQLVPFEELMDEMPGLDFIDIAIAGGVYGHDFLPRLTKLQEHRSLQRFGIRGVGASFHEHAAARISIQGGLVDVAFVRFNAAHPAARSEVLAHLESPRPLLFSFTSTSGHVDPRRLLELGMSEQDWLPRITDHYRYVLSHGGIGGVLCSPSNPEQVEALVAALASGALEPDECRYLENLCLLDRGIAELEPRE